MGFKRGENLICESGAIYLGGEWFNGCENKKYAAFMVKGLGRPNRCYENIIYPKFDSMTNEMNYPIIIYFEFQINIRDTSYNQSVNL